MKMWLSLLVIFDPLELLKRKKIYFNRDEGD